MALFYIVVLKLLSLKISNRLEQILQLLSTDSSFELLCSTYSDTSLHLLIYREPLTLRCSIYLLNRKSTLLCFYTRMSTEIMHKFELLCSTYWICLALQYWIESVGQPSNPGVLAFDAELGTAEEKAWNVLDVLFIAWLVIPLKPEETKQPSSAPFSVPDGHPTEGWKTKPPNKEWVGMAWLPRQRLDFRLAPINQKNAWPRRPCRLAYVVERPRRSRRTYKLWSSSHAVSAHVVVRKGRLGNLETHSSEFFDSTSLRADIHLLAGNTQYSTSKPDWNHCSRSRY